MSRILFSSPLATVMIIEYLKDFEVLIIFLITKIGLKKREMNRIEVIAYENRHCV